MSAGGHAEYLTTIEGGRRWLTPTLVCVGSGGAGRLITVGDVSFLRYSAISSLNYDRIVLRQAALSSQRPSCELQTDHL
jgi:hypothetical protein